MAGSAPVADLPPAGVASVRGHAIAVAVGPGIELETWIQGPDDGLPVLFIHGGYGGPVTTLLGTPPWFDGVFSTEDPVRLIRYSRRNAGASTYVLEPFDLPDLAADALGLLDALGVDRAVVIGSSAGGPVAVQLALTWPERVVALGLPNTAAAIMSDRPAGLDGLLSPMVMARLDEVAGRLAIVDEVSTRGAEAVFGERADEIRDGLIEAALTRAETLDVAPDPYLALAAAVDDEELLRQWYGAVLNWGASAGHDHDGRLGEIEVPTLVVHGDVDDIVPFELGVHLHRRIPGSRLVRIAGAAHEVTRDPRAAAVIREWVLEVGARNREGSAGVGL